MGTGVAAMRNVYLAFVLGMVVLIAGFWPTTFGSDDSLDWLRIVHGVLATVWTTMLIVQAWLAGRWKIGPHRVIGWSSIAIAPILVITGVMIVLDATRHSLYFSRELRIMLAWTDLTTLVVFTLLWLLAIVYRRRCPLHARYVGCTMLVIIPPALGRLMPGRVPGIHGLTAAIHPSYALCAAIAAALLTRDLIRRNGRAMPYAITTVGILFIEFSLWHAPNWPWFVGFLEAVGPIG